MKTIYTFIIAFSLAMLLLMATGVLGFKKSEALIFSGSNDLVRNDKNLPANVDKFTDGDVTCYTYYHGGISCLQIK